MSLHYPELDIIPLKAANSIKFYLIFTLSKDIPSEIPFISLIKLTCFLLVCRCLIYVLSVAAFIQARFPFMDRHIIRFFPLYIDAKVGNGWSVNHHPKYLGGNFRMICFFRGCLSWVF